MHCADRSGIELTERRNGFLSVRLWVPTAGLQPVVGRAGDARSDSDGALIF
jgi:hypothetical protein